MEHLEYLKTQDPQLENLMLKMSKQYKTGLNRILPLYIYDDFNHNYSSGCSYRL